MSLPLRSTRPWVLALTASLAALLAGCGETVTEEVGQSLRQSRFEARAPGFRASAAIAAGYLHSCAVLADGTARCWGDNSTGQLGDGTTTARSTAVAVSGLSSAIGLAAGGGHSCALLADGQVRCWGKNSGGQLGDGTGGDSSISVAVTGLSGALSGAKLAVGSEHTCSRWPAAPPTPARCAWTVRWPAGAGTTTASSAMARVCSA